VRIVFENVFLLFFSFSFQRIFSNLKVWKFN